MLHVSKYRVITVNCPVFRTIFLAVLLPLKTLTASNAFLVEKNLVLDKNDAIIMRINTCSKNIFQILANGGIED